MTNVTDTDSNEELQQGGSEVEAEPETGAAKGSGATAPDDEHDDGAALGVHSQDADSLSGETMESVMDMYEESFKRFAEGEVVTGRIISIDRDHVLVDIGYKSEGQIRIQEFRDENGEIKAQIDDKIEVMVEWWDDDEERVILSKEKAANVKVWEAIKVCYDDDSTIKGTITNRVKGGFSVDIGVQAFLPGSQADLTTDTQPG